MSRGWELFLWMVLTVLVVVGMEGCKSHGPQDDSGKVAAVKTWYQCPMHPEVVREKPGECPICHMKLQPVEVMDQYKTESPIGVAGRVPFKLSPQRQQFIGVTFAQVEKMDLERVIRASGRIAYDPELYSAMEEYRQAVETAKSLPNAKTILSSTKMKVRVLGLSDAQIAQLATRSEESAVGLVLGRAGGSVWVYADVYEYEMNLVVPGQVMEISSPALPGEVFTGKVLSIDPVVNAVTRTARVRAEVKNPEGKFRPEMYLDIKIRVPLGNKMAIPQNAVLDTGEKQIVFVVGEDGSFEPREVRLGTEAEGYYAVGSGLEEGMKIVTSANFLIDSEAQFRAALEAFKKKGGEMPGGHVH
ncbi:MAG: efflux RND transporter periplasmic adaptor subunit [Elusimicrobia bacterium]|nr:efflux RND transporter periplasmic adaptor subunit [Elusimicrobiota bacterium]